VLIHILNSVNVVKGGNCWDSIYLKFYSWFHAMVRISLRLALYDRKMRLYISPSH